MASFLDVEDKEEFLLTVDGNTKITVFATKEMSEKLHAGDPALLSRILKESNPSQPSSSTVMNSNIKNENKLVQWPVVQSRSASVWSVGAEKLVLEIYKELESGPPLKNKWENVSKQMAQKNYSFTGEQCRLLKNLKERHLKLKKKLNKSGSDNPMDELESDMEDTFGTQPDVHPVHSIDSLSKNQEECVIINDTKTAKGIARGSSWVSDDDSDEDARPKPKTLKEDKDKKKCQKPKTKEELPFYNSERKSLWLGEIHHCYGRTSCHIGVLGNLYNRQQGDFIKNHWGFTKIAYNLTFPKTTPRYFVIHGSKTSEFKFHPGCRNGC